MTMREGTIVTAVKWIVAVCSYSFLAYVLWSFDGYGDLMDQWLCSVAEGRVCWLVGVLMLVPLNLALEAWKWKTLVAGVQSLSLWRSFKAVLAGNVAAFFTVNRLGEIPGRCVMLDEGNRARGVVLMLASGMSQTLAICMFGVPSLAVLALSGAGVVGVRGMVLFAVLFASVLTVYFLLPLLARKVEKSRWASRIERYVSSLGGMSGAELARVLGISSLRYVVFAVQYYMLLRLFLVDMPIANAIILIATNYLIITFVPSMSFSEVAVRAGVASVVFSSLTGNVVGVVATGVAAWTINYLMPMIIGTALWLRKE